MGDKLFSVLIQALAEVVGQRELMSCGQASHSRLEETDALGWRLAYQRLRHHGRANVIVESYRDGRELHAL